MKHRVFGVIKNKRNAYKTDKVSTLCHKRSDHLLLEKVLPVAEGAKFGLLLFVLKLFVGRTKVEDEVLEGEDDPLQRK